MTATVLSRHVTAYAAQVRAHLADLTRDQLEDLTDGLEADLMEALEDPARPITGEIPLAVAGLPDAATTSIIDLTERFGTPKAYAEELRSAAGLPAPRTAKGEKPVRPPLAHRVRARLAARRAWFVAQSWWPGARATGEALRPLWWVVRGWVLFNIVVTMVSGAEDVYFLPANVFGIMVLLAVVAASIQHGQGRWTVSGRGRHILTAVSVVAAVGIFPVVMTASAHSGQVVNYGGYSEPEPIADGVYFGGLPVTNLFVYGADGEFIDQAQIVDDKGRPVRVDREGGIWDGGTSRYWSPAEDAYGREIWNVFPLRMWSDQDAEWDNETQTWMLPEGMTLADTPPPFVQLAPLAKDQGEPQDQGEPATGAGDPASGTPTAGPADPAAPADPGAPTDPTASNQAPTDPAAPQPADVPPAG